jgi:excinuclease ABC subunit A
LEYPEGTKLMLLAPVVRDRKGEYQSLFEQLRSQGYVRVRVDGELMELDQPIKLDLYKKHTIEVVVDRIKVRKELQQRLAESFETAVDLAGGIASVMLMDDPDAPPILFSAKFACPQCGYSISELEPRMFSFNNPSGACSTCDGLGVKQIFDENLIIHDEKMAVGAGAVRGWDKKNIYYYHVLSSLAKHYDFELTHTYKKLPKKIKDIILFGSGKEVIEFSYPGERGKTVTRTHPFEGVIPTMTRRYWETDSNTIKEHLAKYLVSKSCASCHGARLNVSARNVFIAKKNVSDIVSMPIDEAKEFLEKLALKGRRGEIAAKIKKECVARLGFLVNVGLDYLSLARSAETLSGGEAQRIRLASQIGSGLVGVMYILDEPSIGLHQRDNERLLKTLNYLRDLGNTVIVVEHDEDAIRSADYVVDIGPGAGVHGGEIIAKGAPEVIMKCKKSLTGQYLSGKKSIAVPAKRTKPDKEKMIKLEGASGNNLNNVTLDLPLGLLTCITGVSGSGKSTLINDTLYPLSAIALNRASQAKSLAHKSIKGLEQLDKVVDIDQSPIGRTPRSNPATYTGLFTPIRELFSGTQEARARGYKPGRFSFNVKGGRCEACQGDGLVKVEMHFLADIYVLCDVCKGKRYNRETLEVKYKGKNIHHVLEMTVEDALEFFQAIPVIKRKLETLMSVGLSYITLGQSAITLSGGEAQRVKLSKELSKRDTGKTLYILDEPTTGLHFADVALLLEVLHQLRDRGNTLVVIEHNLDVIKTADWVVDLGPEGGNKGGEIVAQGAPETVVKCKKSFTGKFLKGLLAKV